MIVGWWVACIGGFGAGGCFDSNILVFSDFWDGFEGGEMGIPFASGIEGLVVRCLDVGARWC